MTIKIERECGCITEEGSVICPECGYDPNCPCCITSLDKEESCEGPPVIW